MEQRRQRLERSPEHDEAERARLEEIAAHDLARVLAQGRSLREVLVGASAGISVLNPGGGVEPVTALGRDYVASGAPIETLRPLPRTVLRVDPAGAAPEIRRDGFHEAARRWARGAERVHVVLESGTQRGILRQVGPDCLVVDQKQGRVAIPLELVCAVRLAHGG